VSITRESYSFAARRITYQPTADHLLQMSRVASAQHSPLPCSAAMIEWACLLISFNPGDADAMASGIREVRAPWTDLHRFLAPGAPIPR
jgi:hypothetical protein